MKLLISFLLLILLQSNVVFAGNLSVDQAKTFMQESGLNELMDTLPEAVKQQLNMQRLTANNDVELPLARRAISSAINAVNGQQLALDYLTKKNGEAGLGEVLNFLASPLGQRISVEEHAANTPDAQLEMQAHAMQMQTTPPPAERIALVKELTAALNADQVILTLMRGTFFSVLDVTRKLNPESAKTLNIEMNNEWQQMKPALSQKFSQFMEMGAHYSYRNISDTDLSAYIQFLKSPDGQASSRAGIELIDAYMKRFVSELVLQLSKTKTP